MMQVLEGFVNASSFYVALAVAAVSALCYFLKTKGLPPGPTGIPYLGLWPFLNDANCHKRLTEYSKKYGDVFSFTFTGRLFIHLGSVKAAREAHVTKSDCFGDRPDGYHILRDYLDKGVVYVKGDYWRTLRKFFLLQFRDRGMNTVKDTLSGPMYSTIREAVAELKKEEGRPVDLAAIILAKCSKIMSQTLFGSEGMSEQEVLEFNKHYFPTLMSMTSTNLLLIGEFARYFIVPYAMHITEGKKGHLQAKDILNKVVQRHKATFDEHIDRDCVDAFFKERIDRERKNDSTAEYFTDEALVVSLIQMIGDGVLFMSIFIITFLNYVVSHPDEQERIYEELIEVVGKDRDPEMEDKNKLTYANAFITEVLRTTDLFTIFPSLECMKETTVGGYRIPKGAITVYNFWAAHMNPSDYENPEKFDPSRFIVKNGQKRPDFLTPFGIGKRSCMGEGFAMIQVFLFLTTIVKNLKLAKPPHSNEKESNLFFYFDNFIVCATPRH